MCQPHTPNNYGFITETNTQICDILCKMLSVGVLAGRPTHLMTTHNMDMQVEYLLATIRPIIDGHTVAFLEMFLFSYFFSHKQQVP